MPDFFILDVKSTGIGARIGLDRAPLATDYNGAGQKIARQVNEWILPKGNQLTIFLYAPPGFTVKPEKVAVSASVYINAPGQDTPTPGRVLATFTWPISAVPQHYPFISAIPIAIPDPPPANLWSEAEKIEELSPADRETILKRIDAFRGMLVPYTSGQALYDLTKYKFDDLARANGGSLDRQRETAVRQYDIFNASPIRNSYPSITAVPSLNSSATIVSFMSPMEAPITQSWSAIKNKRT